MDARSVVPHQLLPHLRFRTSRSSGSGGQHVNKVETRVEVLLSLSTCGVFNDLELSLISAKLHKRINADGDLSVANSETRSQGTNRQRAIDRMVQLINKSLIVPPKRKATKAPKAAVEARVKEKKARGELKAMRQSPKTEG